jgi:hypothetical protein
MEICTDAGRRVCQRRRPKSMIPTDRQQRILDWLRRVYPHEARLFESALWIQDCPSIPYRARFIAHAYRELCSSLANSGGQSSRLELHDLVKSLANAAEKAGLVLDETPIMGDDPKPKIQETLTAPHSVVAALRRLLTAHAARPRGAGRAQHLLDRVLAQRNNASGQIMPTADRLHSMNETFVACCHDRKTDDGELLEGRLATESEFLEEILSAAAAGAVENLSVLDEILDQANS